MPYRLVSLPGVAQVCGKLEVTMPKVMPHIQRAEQKLIAGLMQTVVIDHSTGE